MTTEVAIKGSCACGHVKYTANEMPDYLCHCHCQECRKTAGSPYVTWAGLRADSLTWSTQPDFWNSSKIATRSYCSNCGSNMSMQYHCQPNRISVTAGSIDQSLVPLPKPTEHIFLCEKAAWFDLPEDGLKRIDDFDTPFKYKLEAWSKEHAI